MTSQELAIFKASVNKNEFKDYYQAHGFKSTLGKGTSNQELMLEHGFVEIYDYGQATFVWNNGKLSE